MTVLQSPGFFFFFFLRCSAPPPAAVSLLVGGGRAGSATCVRCCITADEQAVRRGARDALRARRLLSARPESEVVASRRPPMTFTC